MNAPNPLFALTLSCPHPIGPLSRAIAAVSLSCCLAASSLAQEAEQATQAQAQAAEDDEVVESMVVTGSRLGIGDRTANIVSIDAEEIERRGVATVEELIRTIPFALSSLNSQSNMIFGGEGDVDKNLGALGLGTSTINLRGLGSASTVVLLNGRRIAGAAGDEDGFVNISHIPLGAIERVDFQLDGGSAAYGSDTIAGVVNFVTKKNYRGIELKYRTEDSASDADRENFDVLAGTFWRGQGEFFGGGFVTGSVYYRESEPINNRKAGWTTRDFRDQFGPEFDLRQDSYGQPGIVQDQCGSGRWATACGPKRQLPDGHDGTSASPGDFVDPRVLDYVPPQNGAENESQNFSMFFEQDIFSGRLKLVADALYSEQEDYQEFQTLITNVTVPASNAFNPYGKDLKVGYWPGREIEELGLPPNYTFAETEHTSLNYGFVVNFNDLHRLHVTRTDSEDKKYATQVRMDSPSFLNDNNPVKAVFEELLASSDPSVALNLFGDGSVQSPRFAELATFALGPSVDATTLEKWELKAEGEFNFLLPSPIHYAVVAETSETSIKSDSFGYVEGGELDVRFDELGRIGVEEPTLEHEAWFIELGIPVFEKHRWAHEVLLNLQVREDTYTQSGAVGTDADGELNVVDVENGDTTFRIGLLYAPVPSLEFRLSRQDSYKTPKFGDLFSTRNTLNFNSIYTDPYAPGGPATLSIPTEFNSANLLLDAETSTNWTASVTWAPDAIPGFKTRLLWSEIVYEDQISFGSTLLFEYPEVAFTLPDIVQRDAEGNAVLIRNSTLNIAEKVSEIWKAEVSYRVDTSIGEFLADLYLHNTAEEYFKVTPTSEAVDRVGTAGGTDDYRVTAHLTYIRDRLTVNLNARFTPSYENHNTGRCFEVVGRCERAFANRPSLKVNSGTVVDANIAYQFDMGLNLRFGGMNIFEEEFPTVYGSQGYSYDPTRYDARGRTWFLQALYKWGNNPGR